MINRLLRRAILKAFVAAVFATVALAAPAAFAAGEVNIYTDRQEVFLRRVLGEFEKATGIKTNVLYAQKGLLARLKAEGDASAADLVIAADIGRMYDFTAAGLLAPYNDAGIAESVSPGYATDNWVALTRRARIFYIPKNAGDMPPPTSYADLARADYRGKVCLRSGLHQYNIGLFADIIGRMGEAKAREWLTAARDNLARAPQGKDRTQINDVAAGVCGVGIANSYYYFQILARADGAQRLKNVTPVIPMRPHINLTAAGVVKTAPNRDNAIALLRFLVSPDAQRLFAEVNGEFPARDDIALPPALAPYAAALANAGAPAEIWRWRVAASKMVEELNFNR